MLTFETGDVLSADVEALVNTVNCVGVMGRGVALQFKNAFPDNYKAYAEACRRSDVQPGRMFTYDRKTITNPRYIINFPTKRHWRGPSRIEDIEAGLCALRSDIQARGIGSVAVPPLGSGLGGLEWASVRARIVAALGDLADVRVIVYEPSISGGGRAMAKRPLAPKMTAGRAALVGLMQRYIGGLLDPFVTLLEVHKLMYLMQESGERLRLRYVKAPHGPYAENLRSVLVLVEGHLVSGYGDGGDQPGKQLELVPGAVEDAQAFLAGTPETRRRIERVAELVSGFETPFGLELLTTVHWAATREAARNPEEAKEAVRAWGERKRRFTPAQVELAFGVLSEHGWLDRQRVLATGSLAEGTGTARY